MSFDLFKTDWTYQEKAKFWVIHYICWQESITTDRMEHAFWSSTLPDDIPSTKGKDLFPVMDAFQQKHYLIADYFNSGKGIDLQNIDSHISEQVLLY